MPVYVGANRSLTGKRVLQCVAVCCSVLHSGNIYVRTRRHGSAGLGLKVQCHAAHSECGSQQYSFAGKRVSQCVAVYRSVLQCVAVCRSELQCVAVCRSVLQRVAVCHSVLQCVAARRSMFQVCRSVFQCVAMWCSTLPCVAVCCRVLHTLNMGANSICSQVPIPISSNILLSHKFQHSFDIQSVQHTATHCNTRQSTAPHCNTLEHTFF